MNSLILDTILRFTSAVVGGWVPKITQKSTAPWQQLDQSLVGLKAQPADCFSMQGPAADELAPWQPPARLLAGVAYYISA